MAFAVVVAIITLGSCRQTAKSGAAKDRAPSQPVDKGNTPPIDLRKAETARIAVDPFKGASNPTNDRYFAALKRNLPFEETVRKALIEAGFAISNSERPDELVVRVTHHHDAYAIFDRWTEAAISGTVTASRNGSPVASAPYSGVAKVPVVLSPEQFREPADAPFREAFENSNFTEAVARVLASSHKVVTTGTPAAH